MDLKCIVVSALLSISILSTTIDACRVNSELLKSYALKTTERLLNVERFGAIYWPDEPLPASVLCKSTGLNITLAETHFHVEKVERSNEVSSAANDEKHQRKASTSSSLIQDIFVTCSIERDRSYALSINLEIDNPFKVVDVYYDSQALKAQATNNSEQQQQQQQHHHDDRRTSLFRIYLPESSLLVQLNQRIRYDECLSVNYVQLSPTVNYEIECVDCEERGQAHLDEIFNKRMSQLDAELDAILSEKVLFGLQILLNQQRLDLDMYLDQ